MAIYYIDVDDEITSAAARIRDSSETRIALVIQGGSRVATSRINFRLLAREARNRGRRLAIIAADPSVRSLAQAAELPVFTAVSEYQRAEAARPPGSQPGGADAVGDALDGLAATVDAGSGASAGVARVAGSRLASGSGRPMPRAGRRFGLGVAGWLALALVAALVAGAFGAFLLWPSATVVLTLREEPLGPLNLAIRVDPGITAVNDSTLTVPGVSQEFAAQASGTFNATGQNVVDTAATGAVTFRSGNTGSSVTIPAGTQVETAGKVAFATTSTVTVPKARLSGLTVIPGTGDAAVTAVKKGLAGNVAAGAIVNVPPWLATALVIGTQVTNQKATSGGTHTVTPFVQQSDIDAAEAGLSKQLDSLLQAKMTDPASVAAGFELFSSTAHMGDPAFNPDPATLLNQQLTSFDLTANGSGTATAANLATVRSLAERKIRATVQAGHTLVEGSVVTTFGSPDTVGSAISMPVLSTALQAATVDVAQLRSAIEGKSVEDARAYLSKYGDAQVSISPFWASTVSGFDFRIDMRVVAPTAHTAPSARLTPAPVRAATPTEAAAPTDGATPTDEATPVPSASPAPSAIATLAATASSAAAPTATP